MTTVSGLKRETRDDPYSFNAIASNLSGRESSRSSAEVDLPVLLPLSHTHPHLAASSHHLPFSADDFLLTRASHTSLSDLRTELRDYLAQLKEELVALINKDYGDFVSLGTDLRGEGERLERLGKPLDSMKDEVEVARQELATVRVAVQDRLAERATLREEKALLHLLVTLSDSLIRLESLLAISHPPSEDGVTKMTNGSSSYYTQSTVATGGAKHLSRVASEYLQMLYHADKARSERCAFISSNQWRVERIHDTLTRDLDTLFASLLPTQASTSSAAFSEGYFAAVPMMVDGTSASDRGRKLAEMNECLRTYDALGGWQQAEEVLRRDIVRPFVRKTIHSSALSAPLSPLLPQTPFGTRAFRNSISHNPISPPAMTPFGAPSAVTPYVAHAPHLLNEDTALAVLYNQLLRFIERDLSSLFENAERISRVGKGKRAHTPNGDNVDGRDQGEERFEFLANVVWAEISAALMDELGGQLFAAGKPDEFLTNYRTTSDFLASLETLCPSVTSVLALRSHPTRRAFDRRWQLPVYFQLRWKEIVVSLEDTLTGQGSVRDPTQFNTPQADAAWHALEQCWSDDVYVHELGDRFWKLSLQILSRYKVWVEGTLPVDPGGRLGGLMASEKQLSTPAFTAPSSRTSTPVPPGTPENGTDATAADETNLRQMAYTLRDLKRLEGNVWDLFESRIGVSIEEPEERGESAQDALRASLFRLLSPVPLFTSQIVSILTRRCADPLRQVRSITSQYRAMSNKRDPTEPSYFVPGILRPLKVFFDPGGPGEGLQETFGSTWAQDVFEDIAKRYTDILVEMKKTEDSLRRFKQGKKTTFSLFGSSSGGAKEEEGKDEERVKKQMTLDISALRRDAEALGVNVAGSEAFRTLRETLGISDVP